MNAKLGRIMNRALERYVHVLVVLYSNKNTSLTYKINDPFRREEKTDEMCLREKFTSLEPPTTAARVHGLWNQFHQ
jgi:hypothetical protein